MKYKDVLNKVYAGDPSRIPSRLLCLDPGETTGWSLFERGKLTYYGQIETVTMDKQPAWHGLSKLFYETDPTHVVCEDYRVYAHKLERHSNSSVVTLRLIGGIDFICRNTFGATNELGPYIAEGIPLTYQMATQAKGFVTDDRLKSWDFWKPGMRHSRDAIRHGLYFLIVTNRPEVKK